MMEVLEEADVLTCDVEAQVCEELTERLTEDTTSELSAEIEEVMGLVLDGLLY